MLLNRSVVRFAIVGVVNTLIDVSIFLALRSAGISLILANICSTSVALLVSFILNNRYTFKSRGNKKNKFVPFVGITLIGLWILQPLVIKLLLSLHKVFPYTKPFVAMFGSKVNFQELFAKLGAIGVTLVWNYIWYSKVVFAHVATKEEE